MWNHNACHCSNIAGNPIFDMIWAVNGMVVMEKMDVSIVIMSGDVWQNLLLKECRIGLFVGPLQNMEIS